MNLNRFYRPVCATLLGLVLIVSAVTAAPRAVHAQLIVNDPVNLVQNTITAAFSGKGLLNPVFYALGQQILTSVVKSTVNWINSGFNGSPAFVTNLSATLQQAGDTEAQVFINQFLANGLVNSPFSEAIGQAALNDYLKKTSTGGFFSDNAFTLGQVSPNPTAFLSGDFSQGGLTAWMSTVLGGGNNPIALQNAVENELGGRVSTAQGSLLTQLGWGSGFKSFQGNCAKATVGSGIAGGASNIGGAGNTTSGVSLGGSLASSVSLTGTDPCAGQPIKTPGTVIMASLDKSLGSNIDTLVNAKEFDEIVNSLLSQLLNQVLSGGGLSGVSQPSSTGTSFIDTPPTTAAIGGTGVSAGVSVATSMTQIVTGQAIGLQQYVGNWQSILTAANAAKSALSTSSCTPGAANILSTRVQPVIDEGTLAISNATAAIATLTKIEAEIPGANTSGDATLQSAQAAGDYSAFLAAPTTPSPTDITFATTQSFDTGTATPASLLTQMNQLAAQAKCGP